MASMYDTIMELPLFKGIGEAQLSLMLEKTSMEFLKFQAGETIVSAGEPVKSIDFILKGRVRKVYTLEKFPIEILETSGEGGMIGAMNLYGMETFHPATIISEELTSLLRLNKNQYMNVLQSDGIYLLNFVNYLSACAQKGPSLLLDSEASSIINNLRIMAFSIVERRTKFVKINASDRALADYCGVTEEEFLNWKAKENFQGIIYRAL